MVKKWLFGQRTIQHQHLHMAGLAVLFSSQDFFFQFSTLVLIYLSKYKTIETQARAILPLNMSDVGSVAFYQSSERSFEEFFCLAIVQHLTYRATGFLI